MTTPDDVHPATDTRRARRDVAAVVLMVLGTAGLVALAWSVDARLLGALICLAAVGAGVYLGLERD